VVVLIGIKDTFVIDNRWTLVTLVDGPRTPIAGFLGLALWAWIQTLSPLTENGFGNTLEFEVMGFNWFLFLPLIGWSPAAAMLIEAAAVLIATSFASFCTCISSHPVTMTHQGISLRVNQRHLINHCAFFAQLHKSSVLNKGVPKKALEDDTPTETPKEGNPRRRLVKWLVESPEMDAIEAWMTRRIVRIAALALGNHRVLLATRLEHGFHQLGCSTVFGVTGLELDRGSVERQIRPKGFVRGIEGPEHPQVRAQALAAQTKVVGSQNGICL